MRPLLKTAWTIHAIIKVPVFCPEFLRKKPIKITEDLETAWVLPVFAGKVILGVFCRGVGTLEMYITKPQISKDVIIQTTQCLVIKHLVYMAIGHVILNIDRRCNIFHAQPILYKPCKAYAYCWENKYMHWPKNHLPRGTCNHNILCALGQHLHAHMGARLNVEPWTLMMP